MTKTYEEIAKELQQQIDDRKAADRLESLRVATSAQLAELGYVEGNHDAALAILEPFFDDMEDEAAAEEQAIKLHHAILGNSDKTTGSVFK